MLKRKKITSVIVIALLLLGVISPGCASRHQSDRITPEELAVLRKEHPYNDEMGLIDLLSTLETFKDVNSPLYQYHAVAVVTLSGNWHTGAEKEISPFDNSDEAAPIVTTTLSGFWCDAEVEKVLWGGEELNSGDMIKLSFGSTLAADSMCVTDSFLPGETYVCFLFRTEKDGVLRYPTNKRTAYKVVNENIVLSITSEPGIDEASGMYLDAFATLVNETLGPPDAELTPVEPELETE